MSKKNLIILWSLLTISFSVLASKYEAPNPPDSVYLFAYGTGRSGLHLAWSSNQKNWNSIGNEYSFVNCDYARWGAEKKMFDPFLMYGEDHLWHCFWTLNDHVGAFAHAASKDLIQWQRQSYPLIMEDGNCRYLQCKYVNSEKGYQVSWLSDRENEKVMYSSTTTDFKNYSVAQQNSGLPRQEMQVAVVMERERKGTIHKVEYAFIKRLQDFLEAGKQKSTMIREKMVDDSSRFASLKDLDATITINKENTKAISDKLIGVFFEDISYAADGGLYAELVQNRDFEYQPDDKGDVNWNSRTAWSTKGEVEWTIDTIKPIHKNNPHYAVLQIKKQGASLLNEGYDGICLKAGEKYDFSFFARLPELKRGKVVIRLVDAAGKIYAETTLKTVSSEWKKYQAVLTAKESVSLAFIELIPQIEGRMDVDMISLFPQKTFHGRKNGLRADLAQTIADLHPRFVRFPGGCVSHGDGLDNIYRWKNTVGPLEARLPMRNIWNYHQSMGLGYHEYFLFCEDIQAEPLPVLAAGVPCQNSGHNHKYKMGGQQGGIPMCDMNQYVQDVLDLIEYANGDARLTVWGKKRAEAGHAEPFHLKYIGIGNEDQITDVFEERFAMIYKAVKEKYPDITVIGTVGPFYEGTDYEEGWKLATKYGVPMVDEHYYVDPGWLINNQDYYDNYDRSKSKVYLGEYAAHLPGRPNNLETALAEAIYLSSVERNGDVVAMTSYAPLLAKEKHTNWTPDLIYFNNEEIKPTVGYYVQQLYGQNAGDLYLNSKIQLSNQNENVCKRVAVSVVKDSETGDIILKLSNLLPVRVKIKWNIEEFLTEKATIKRSVLTGEPADRKLKPIQQEIDASSIATPTLPPYSFTVIRIETSNLRKK